ncbi:hypothetical protein GCM10017668_01230 [Streptomyces tuirus]|uniref:Uncharacterized protein n=1 Tax=Streptomyces tuirus TaxID=68278 RepID=A0A7G1N9D3_9ACTN|nr:hypothetical protein GCM10017668_01230 [Streptomyces tuirus]
MRRYVLDAMTSSALHGKWDVRGARLLVGYHTRVTLQGAYRRLILTWHTGRPGAVTHPANGPSTMLL